MKCPKCDAGNIRVMTLMACSCGHHSLVCDGCSAVFKVACGEPHGPSALPPEVPMSEDCGFAAQYEKLRAEGAPVADETFKDFFAQVIRDAPDQFPLLEDFKASLQTGQPLFGGDPPDDDSNGE